MHHPPLHNRPVLWTKTGEKYKAGWISGDYMWCYRLGSKAEGRYIPLEEIQYLDEPNLEKMPV